LLADHRALEAGRAKLSARLASTGADFGARYCNMLSHVGAVPVAGATSNNALPDRHIGVVLARPGLKNVAREYGIVGGPAFTGKAQDLCPSLWGR
jgi:hypothetical protein